MKYIKTYENKRLDFILDKISKSGMDSLSNYEKEFLVKKSNDESTKELEKEMDSKIYHDEIGPYKATLKLYDIEDTYENYMGVENYSKWYGKLIVDDEEYSGEIIFKNNDYLSGYFENEKGDIFSNLEGMYYEIDSFLSYAFYHAIGQDEHIDEGRIFGL